MKCGPVHFDLPPVQTQFLNITYCWIHKEWPEEKDRNIVNNISHKIGRISKEILSVYSSSTPLPPWTEWWGQALRWCLWPSWPPLCLPSRWRRQHRWLGWENYLCTKTTHQTGGTGRDYWYHWDWVSSFWRGVWGDGHFMAIWQLYLLKNIYINLEIRRLGPYVP